MLKQYFLCSDSSDYNTHAQSDSLDRGDNGIRLPPISHTSPPPPISHNMVNSNTIRKAREINVLFNDALNTFYLRLYGVIHMVKDHSDSENRLLLSINSKGYFICTIPQTG